MSFVLAVNIRIKPESVEAFMKKLADNAAAARKEPACKQVDVLVDPKDKPKVMLYEIYNDETTEYSAVGNKTKLSLRQKQDPPRDPGQSLQEEIAALTARRISEALASTGGNQTHAARLIGMPLRTFITQLKDLKQPGDKKEE